MLRKGWNFGDAVKFLKEINPILKEAGYKGSIVGGIINRGYSDKDLDILLEPIKEDYNFGVVLEALPGDFTLDMETYEHWTKDGKLVDFHFKEGG